MKIQVAVFGVQTQTTMTSLGPNCSRVVAQLTINSSKIKVKGKGKVVPVFN
jgi:hypothetical protein